MKGIVIILFFIVVGFRAKAQTDPEVPKTMTVSAELMTDPGAFSCWMPTPPTKFWYKLEKIEKLD